MKINWKARFKNPHFIAQLILSIGAPILAYMGLTAQDLTSWSAVFNLILNALSNPYVLGLVVVSVYNALLDPTVAGLSDSKRALKYDKPRNDKDFIE